MKKTNALRILDRRKVGYETLEYNYNSENLSVEKIASDNNLKVNEVFKTLVAKGNRSGVVVAVISGDKSLNMRALAKASGNKKITLIPVKELLSLTGYIRGGCSPIGMKKPFPVYIDIAANDVESLYVNAGERGLLLKIKTEDLVKVTKGKLENITN